LNKKMKICQTCQQYYEKPEQQFCPQDGTPLVAALPQDAPQFSLQDENFQQPNRAQSNQDSSLTANGVNPSPDSEPPPSAWQKINLQTAQPPPFGVSVQFEQPRSAYFPGDVIRGTVTLDGAPPSPHTQNLAIGLISEEQ